MCFVVASLRKSLTANSSPLTPHRLLLASLITVIDVLEQQQIIYDINKNMTYTNSNGSILPHQSHKMFLPNYKPFTKHKLAKVLGAVGGLAKVVLVGMLHPLGDGGEVIIEALKGGEIGERGFVSNQSVISNLHHLSHHHRLRNN